MYKRYKTGQYPTVNGICEFLCTSQSDIDKLPKYNVEGTQDGDAFDNTPCGYRSVAMVCDGTNPTELYILNPENNWVKMLLPSGGSGGGGSGEEEINSLQMYVDTVKDLTGFFAIRAYPESNYTTSAKYFTDNTTVTDEIVRDILSRVDCREVKATVDMFQHCKALSSIPYFNTSKVTNMGYMFAYCSSLTSIPLLDTSNTISMDYMFFNCPKLETIPLLNTNKVNSMAGMFSNGNTPNRKLTTIPPLDTSNVTDMGSMFYGCSALTTVPLFNTSNVTKMGSMFDECSKLTTVPLFNTSNVTAMSSMFRSCTSLTTVPQLDMRYVTSTSNMFANCKALTEIWIKNIKTALKVGSGTSYGHLLTVDSLVHLCYECRDTGSLNKLTVGTANLEKLANVYVKLVDITEEMRAEDDLVDEKLPFVRCESTDDGAILITDYLPAKNWEIN